MNDNKEQSIREAVEARKQAEAASLAEIPKKDNEITSAFVKDCLYANELGDGTLFAAIHAGKFIYNKTTQRWLRWAGHHWEVDRFEKVYAAVDDVARKYLSEGDALSVEINKAIETKEEDKLKRLRSQQRRFKERGYNLRGTRADKCLSWAHRVIDGLSAQEDQFDVNPWLLGCVNGVIELNTGRFRPGRPADMIIKAVPHMWNGIESSAPTWEKFISAINGEDTELSAYIQRLFGYGVTGLVKEHKFAVLYGEEGRNGKGTLIETLRHIMGPLADPIQSEMLLDQRFGRSSSGPSPDIMALKGLRLAFASETDKGRRFSAGKVKWLSGGDTIKGRSPNDKYETTFPPTHMLVLLTNHLPHAPAEDKAFWDRMHAIPFKMRFVDNPAPDTNDRPRDKELPDKLKEETPGILAWLVKGCLEWQRQGLNPPEIILKTTEKYRFDEDVLANFIAETCEPTESTPDHVRTKYSEIYKTFRDWYEASHGDLKYAPKKKEFGNLMDRLFKRETKGGHIWFIGIQLISTDDTQPLWEDR